MKKHVFASLVFISVCFSSMSLLSQNQKTTMDLLMSTKWEPQNAFDEGDYGYVRFSNIQRIFKYRIRNKIDSSNYSYYLSKTSDTVFDKTKVGKNSTGKYIISDGPGIVFIDEILELTSSKLVIRKSTPGYSSYGHKVTYLPTNMSF